MFLRGCNPPRSTWSSSSRRPLAPLSNLFEVLTRSLDRYRPAMRTVSDRLSSASPAMSPIGKPTLAAERKQQRRESRLQLYQERKPLMNSNVSPISKRHEDSA